MWDSSSIIRMRLARDGAKHAVMDDFHCQIQFSSSNRNETPVVDEPDRGGLTRVHCVKLPTWCFIAV